MFKLTWISPLSSPSFQQHLDFHQVVVHCRVVLCLVSCYYCGPSEYLFDRDIIVMGNSPVIVIGVYSWVRYLMNPAVGISR